MTVITSYMPKMVRRTSHKVTLYVRYQSACIYKRLLPIFTARHDTAANIMSKPISAHSTVRGSRQTASSNSASVARFLTPTRNPFSRSNQKSLWWPKQNLYRYRPVEMERIKRHVCGTKQIVRRHKNVHSSCGCFINRRCTKCHGTENAMRDFHTPPARPDISCLPYK